MRFLLKRQKSELPDEEIIRAFRRNGDSESIGVLFERYSHLLFGVCMHMVKDEELSKDIVLNIFEKLPDNLRKYDIRNFSSWVYQVAKNHCLRAIARNKLQSDSDELGIRLADESTEDKEESILREVLLTDLEKAISSLEEHQKQCIELFYLQEKSYQEVMEHTGFSYKQVKSYLQNGKRNLRQLLKRNNAENE